MNYRDGVLLVDKPSGMTSHDIVDFIRRKSGFKKVGHAGTLDPMATGVLIVLLGSFTKRFNHFSNYDKEYKARLCLGISTDTADREGNIIEKRDLNQYAGNIKNIKEIFSSFLGEIKQIPPMYSAKKVKSRKLYELARRGVTVKRESKTVFIKEIRILEVSMPYVTFYMKCSKGTYVRQLASDIGERIGCGAHLVSLKRTGQGPFGLGETVPFDRLKNKKEMIYENILQPE